MNADAWSLITDDAGLQAASEVLANGEGPFGVDTERASGYTYSNRAYLVQVFRRGAGTYLFDPVTITDFAPLAEALANEEWILHSADQDLPSLKEIGLVPARLFDTELASRLLGLERVGLGAVVLELLDIELAKAHSASNWSTRPLPEPWLEYAALDVALLPDLRDAVAARLEEADKTEIAEQEFEAVRVRLPKPKAEDPWRKITTSSRMKSPRQHAMTRELWQARDAFAQAEDVAPGRLLPDSSIAAAVLANPRSAGELASLKTFRGRASRSELDRWWRAILKGKTTEDLPKQKKRESGGVPSHRGWSQRHPEAADRLAELRAVVTAEAERQNMPPENLISPALVRDIAWAPPADTSVAGLANRLSDIGARPWQVAAVAPVLATVFVE